MKVHVMILTLLTVSFSTITAQQSSAPVLPAQPEIHRQTTIARLGFVNGIALDGATAAAPIDFPLPPAVRITRGNLTLALDVTKIVSAGSNLQLFINGQRRLFISRTPESPSPLAVPVALTAADLSKPSLHVELRSYLAIGRDRCVDERLGSAYVTILPESRLEYYVDPASVRSVQAIYGLLRDTVQIGLPARALSPAEFELGYRLEALLRTDGHVVNYGPSAAAADLQLDSARALTEMIAWRKLVSQRSLPLGENPTVDQIGVANLSHMYGYRTSWIVPLDLRVMSTDRVPDGINLEVLSSPSSYERGVQFHVFMNGTLLRSIVIPEDGKPKTIHVDLPQYLLSTYNEVRIEAQRHRDAAEYCQEAEALYPAQVFGSSVITTRKATKETRLFTGAAVRLPEHFALYLPQAALSTPESFLHLTAALSRGIWGNRTPRFEFFKAGETPSPENKFVIIGLEKLTDLIGPVLDSAGKHVLSGSAVARTVLSVQDDQSLLLQIAKKNGHYGIVATLPKQTISASDLPETYSNNDVVIQAASALPFSLNSHGVGADLLYGDFTWLARYAWTTREIAGIAVGLFLLFALIWTAYVRDKRARRRISAAAEQEKVDTGATTV